MAKAIILSGVGLGTLQLGEIPNAVAGPGELVIAVEAASINPVDRGAVDPGYGEKMPGAAPWVLGWDAAGRVTSVGEGVESELVGTRVLVFSQWFKGGPGLQRSQVAASREAIAVVGDSIPASDLTTFGLNGLTALQALDAAGLTAGQSLLVLGAGGGVGGFVAQLAEHRGITVVRGGRDTSHTDLAGLELDALVNTAPLDPTSYLKAIADDGVAISVTTPAEAERGIRSSRVGVKADRAGLETVARLAEEGVLTTEVSLSLPAIQAAEAYRAEVSGRTVVTF